MLNKTFAFWIKFRPNLCEQVKCLLTDFEAFFVLRRIKAFEDNSDEQVQEDEGDNNHKADEEAVSNYGIAAFLPAVLFEAVVIL